MITEEKMANAQISQISSEDGIQSPLLPYHRDAMLDLILTWAKLDGALGMLLSRFLGLPMHQGAEKIGKLRGSAKIAQMVKLLRDVEAADDLVKNLRKMKKTYEKYSDVRNRIAHSNCVGFSAKDNSYVIFLTFEKVGDEELAVDAVPIEEMERAKEWGENFSSWAQKIVNVTEKPAKRG